MSQPSYAPVPQTSRPRSAPTTTWPHSLSHEPSLRVSDVLALIQTEFPALTTSKLRFLDTQGLVQPQRTPSGYRQYSIADVERLRYVLRHQRDHYRPLTVIADMLTELDAGRSHEPVLPHEVVEETWLSPSQLAQRAGVDIDFVHTMEEHGMIAAASPGQFDAAWVAPVSAAWRYIQAGADVRDVRALLQAASRVSDVHESRTRTVRFKGDDAAASVRERDLGEAAIAVFQAYVRSHYDQT